MYANLREFVADLRKRGELVEIAAPVDPYLEIAEIADRCVKSADGGPALLFNAVRGARVHHLDEGDGPVLLLAATLRNRGITLARSLVGPYITSLEMQGVSITLLRADDEMLRLWDAPVRTPALRWGA